MRAIVLLNHKAGTLAAANGDERERIRRAFASAGVDADVRSLGGHEIPQAARAAIGERPDTIVSGGGDGTQSAVAGALAHSSIPMGVLPLGTLNHFAKDLGIPATLEEAISLIAQGKPRRIDLGQANDRIFVNNSSIGIYPHIVRDRQSQQERLGRGKWLAMFLAAIAALRRYPTVQVQIGVNGRALPRTTPFVFIGNNRYEMDLFAVRGRKYLDEATLSLYVANRPGRFGMLRLAFRALLGTLAQDRDFETLCDAQIRIDSPRRTLHVAIDGEVVDMHPPLHYKTLPGALWVFAPPAPGLQP